MNETVKEYPGLRKFVPASKTSEPLSSKRIFMIWLLGMLALLPMNIVNLPLNMALVDYWNIMAFPILWFFILRGHYSISLAYMVPMWIIFTASLVSSFSAADPSNGLIVVVKEVYTFIWFVTLSIVIARLAGKGYRSLLVFWTAVVVLHALVIIFQFLSPSLWYSILKLAGKSVLYDYYRPSGLYLCDTAGCANKAAYFQLLGFVPLLLAGFSKSKTTMLGITIFLSILLTGSMGATLAFFVGLAAALISLVLIGNQLKLVIRIFAPLVFIAIVLGLVFYGVISLNDRYQQHFQRIILGRADRSSEGRFNLWSRGLEELHEQKVGFWGIGPANFRVVDWQGKQLHNDYLAFLVERGALGALGLIVLWGVAAIRAFNLFLLNRKFPEHAHWGEVVFIAMVAATLFESLTHQIFHDRQLWLVLALLEAVTYRRFVSESRSGQKFGSRRVREKQKQEFSLQAEIESTG